MVKKSKVNKCLEKKSANKKSAPLNPFEIRHSKTKHKVVGVKDKKIQGIPGISRSRAIEKRKKTLGLEYERRLKKNKFVDERFGEQDNSITAEEKMMRRFTMERQKHHSKQNIFNLEEEELTHRGKNIDEIDNFDDAMSSDSDDEPQDHTTDMHFGGFLTKNEGETAVHKSGKDIMDEIVAKSKMQKMERQRERGENQEITDELDKDWNAIHGLLMPHLRSIENKKKKDDYDLAVRELAFESKAKPTDRLKTEEELAKERRDKLEELEKARLSRMKKGTEDVVETSADALCSRSRTKKKEKVMVAYTTEGKMVENKEFDDALDNLKKHNQETMEEDESSEEDGSECDEECDEDVSSEEDDAEEDEDAEENEEAESSEYVDSEDDADDKTELPELAMNTIEEEDGNCQFEEITEEIEEDIEDVIDNKTEDIIADMSSNIQDIPFVIDAPEHMKDFTQLLSHQSDEVVITIIKRIIASNHPSLKGDNKEKTATFFVILIKYLTKRLQEETLTSALLDSSCEAMFSVVKYISREVYTHMFGIVNTLKDVLAKNSGKYLSSVIHKRYVIYLYLIQRLYPVTDYKHAIISPIMISINRAISCSAARKLADIKVGIYLCNYILQTNKTTNRYSPELVHFLTSVISTLAGNKQEYLSTFRFKPDVLLGSPGGSKPGLISINKLYDNDTPQVDVLYALLRTVLQTMRNYRDFTGFHGIFQQLHCSLCVLNLDGYHSNVSDIKTTISTTFEQFSQKVMPFLRYQNLKPVSIKMYEPKFDEVYIDRKKKSGADETQKLKKKIKTEMKGAMREIRKDNKFISGVKHRQQAIKDKTRKRKVNEIMGFLSKEQGEANDLKYKKKRGQI